MDNQPATEALAERRSFFTSLKAGAVAALALGGAMSARAQSKTPFVAARHEKDDWLDAIPGKHRMVIDTTKAVGFSDALLFANNFLLANRNDYGLQNSDVAVLVVARHTSTGFAYNEAMWAKYAAQLSDGYLDPKTQQTPKTNPFLTGGFANIDGLVKQGVQFGVCGMATRRIAGLIATATNQKSADVLAELSANLVPNAHLAAAGIIVVNRAQERGYTFVSA
jgi:intracellular sulfur oxidation DsrE/DsrF family protein